MGDYPSRFGNPDGDLPVEIVSWRDCKVFIQKLNQIVTGGGFRLPTEAEWEYAARAGTTTAFANGDITATGCKKDDKLDAIGWYCGNANNRTHPVAQKQPNKWGLYDVHGNVWEWCQDFWTSEYSSSTETDPQGPSRGHHRVHRGGGWNSNAEVCRSACRGTSKPGSRFSWVGFRLARSQ